MEKTIELKRCGKCSGYMERNDNYCSKCGAKWGGDDFDSADNTMQPAYGLPPVNFTFLCQSCGFEWTEILTINDNKYCPECGAANLKVTKDDGDKMRLTHI